MKKILLLSTVIFMFNFAFGQKSEHRNSTNKGIFSEDFEMTQDDLLASDWTLTSTHPSYKLQISDKQNHTPYGENSLQYDFYNAPENTNFNLISRELQVTEINNHLKFWYIYALVLAGSGHEDELYVDIKSTDATDWTLGTQNIIENAYLEEVWTMADIDLTNYEGTDFTGKTVQVRIRGISKYGSYKLYIDDIKGLEIEGTPASDLILSNVLPTETHILTGTKFTPQVIITNNGVNVESNYEITLKSEPDGYEETIQNPTEIPQGESVQIDFPEWLPEDGNYELIATVSMTTDENTDNNTFTKEIEVRDYKFGDFIYSFNLQSEDEIGISTDGNYIYTSDWWNSKFYKYNMDGTLVKSFEINEAPRIKELTYDGEFFYGSAVSELYKLNFDNETLVATDASLPTEVRAITYIDTDDAFLGNNIYEKSNLVVTKFKFDPAGSESLSSFTLPTKVTSLAYDKWSNPEAPTLLGYKENGDTIVEFDLIGNPTGRIIKSNQNEGGGRGISIYKKNEIVYLLAIRAGIVSAFVIQKNTHIVTFKVKDSNNNPVEAISININEQTLTSNEDGIANIDLADGTYTYTATKENCSEISGSLTVEGGNVVENIEYECNISVNDLNTFKASIYPNPTNDLLTVEANGKYTLKIVDITGKIIYTTEMNNSMNIDMTGYNAGIYFISLTNDNKTENYKILKK